jgi:hypothetical protein
VNVRALRFGGPFASVPLINACASPFFLGAVISQRKRESEFESLQKEAAALTNDINSALIAQLNAKS